MSKNGLGISLIEMYCRMIDEEYKPLIQILNARTEGVEEIVRKQIKLEVGIYALVAKKSALEEQLREVELEIRRKTGSGEDRSKSGQPYRWESDIDFKVKQRLSELNEPLQRARLQMESLKRSVRLSTATSEVKELFVRIGEEVRGLIKDSATLPPISRLIGMTEKQMKKLEVMDAKVK